MACFNAYAEQFNADNAAAIGTGEVGAIEASSVGFIEKASGIKARFMMEKEGILDPRRRVSRIAERADCGASDIDIDIDMVLGCVVLLKVWKSIRVNGMRQLTMFVFLAGAPSKRMHAPC